MIEAAVVLIEGSPSLLTPTERKAKIARSHPAVALWSNYAGQRRDSF